jgi:DNA-directed RNA polymerase specialized sigma subunit
LSNTNNKIEKSWAKSVLALKSHHDALVEEKIIDPERMRLIFADREERKKAVVQLGIKGLSQRQIAAVIGVGLGTVNRDLDVPMERKAFQMEHQSSKSLQPISSRLQAISDLPRPKRDAPSESSALPRSRMVTRR